MIKKLFSYIFLIFFITNAAAEEIIIKCKYKKYKYITKDSGNIILSTNKKVKPKWVGWCPGEKTEDNKNWFVSAKNQKLIISDLKGTCMIGKGEFLMKNGSIGVIRLSTSITDFKEHTYISEFFWMDETKKRKRKEKCKKVKK